MAQANGDPEQDLAERLDSAERALIRLYDLVRHQDQRIIELEALVAKYEDKLGHERSE